MTKDVQLVECPRDAMQGWKSHIPSGLKIRYLNSLLRVGFHSLDFGSFVSPKAIPQMADTKEVLGQLNWRVSRTRLLAIIANLRGAEEAAVSEGVHYLGFPFSVSPTFQQRNTHAGIEESLQRLRDIQDCCVKYGRELVVYLSMAFGNPYGDPYTEDQVLRMAMRCRSLGAGIISLADTVGLASPEQVNNLTGLLVREMPDTTIGVHLHSTPDHWREKVEAAWESGCRRFDGALGGYGGCPMAGDDLVGNMNMEWLLRFLEEKGELPELDQQALAESRTIAQEIFNA
jgi:hydroxymethylglutaryl-CoA lyase